MAKKTKAKGKAKAVRAAAPPAGAVSMFCVKCREKKEVPADQTRKEKTSKGRNMLRAKCPTCGTNMVTFTK